MSGENVLNIKKDKNAYFGSVAFLVFVFLLTGSLYFYNGYIIKDSNQLTDQITEIDVNIKVVEKDKSLEVFALLSANKKTIDLMSSMSHVTKYIDHMRSIASKYSLTFR